MSSLGLPKEFERQVRQIRQYLFGEGVDVTDFNATIEDATAYQSIRTGVRPEKSRLEWLNPSVAPAVLEVAATGPKVMAICRCEREAHSWRCSSLLSEMCCRKCGQSRVPVDAFSQAFLVGDVGHVG